MSPLLRRTLVAGYIVFIAAGVMAILGRYCRHGQATDARLGTSGVQTVVAADPPDPAYILEPPDILLLSMGAVVPQTPYHIGLLDQLQINVVGALADQPISG